VTGATDVEVQAHVATTLVALGDLLARAPEAVWDRPSLCEGWRVREVVAHVTMPARYSAERFTELLAEVGFDFTTLSDRLALEDAQLPTATLVGNLRDDVLHRWTPPGGGSHGALNHAVVHALDVTAAIGEPRVSDDAALRVVLDDLTAGGVHEHFGTELPAATLRATDIEWSFGEGPEITGRAEELVLRLCGRRAEAVPAS
jgi:uncharacterized protein (TIGR03083 family)